VRGGRRPGVGSRRRAAPASEGPPPDREPKKRLTAEERADEKAKKARRRESYVQRTYGITPEMYRDLLEFQGGRCWGCPATGASKSLAVDHDHRTGEVRMALCSTCNEIVGHFRDDPVALVRLGLALVDPPSRAAWLGAGKVHPGWSDE
jgi:hypothetical protein